MNAKAQVAAQNGIILLEQIVNVGDKVLATINGGSKFVSCYVYAIEESSIKFLWNGVVVSLEKQFASDTVTLVRKFDRKAIIAEIMSLAGAA